MAKTKSYQVINRRMLFRCFECGAKKYIAVGLHLRRKTVRCHRCSETTNCLINRRQKPRDTQTGKAVLITPDGIEYEIYLHNVSPDGMGFEISPGGAFCTQKLDVGQEVSFKCGWNSFLFDRSRFVVKYIRERRVGVKKI